MSNGDPKDLYSTRNSDASAQRGTRLVVTATIAGTVSLLLAWAFSPDAIETPASATTKIRTPTAPPAKPIVWSNQPYELELPKLDFDSAELSRNPDLARWSAQTTTAIAPATLLNALARTAELSAPNQSGEGDIHAAARLAATQLLSTLERSAFEPFTPERLKTIATDRVLRRLGPPDQPPRYNRDSTTLAAIVREGSWQCASGTLVFGLTALRLPAPVIRDHDFVIIYERGHVLPGYAFKFEDEWHLVGLEMTVVGIGQKRFGAIPRLADAGFALRILQAPEAWLLQAAAPFLHNDREVALHILRQTAARYDVPLAGLEANIRRLPPPPAGDDNNRVAPAIASPWAFGHVTVPPGDLPMMASNRVPAWSRPLPYFESSDAFETEEITPGSGGPPSAGRLAYPWDDDYPSSGN
ncbi:hypothetical protein [Synoicihabitans lomoniglobus]|uniref:Uncharacterized protein n=1 Tax=Synoicihabitans lomoniglobus TaxID=2909285 RepID=A0AAF0I465_9BACT|nr:hypothetical protein [Opitutaceae bacterium LMO-M01]WED66584.1 hypothetical protein PXH66_06945 [Opitutaceae bacterium LMO-M01]